MGCWDETCALSGLGIRSGESTVRVQAKWPWREFNESNKIGIFMDPRDFLKVYISEGAYDDYGGLKNIEHHDDTDVTYFFHSDLWAWAQEEWALHRRPYHEPISKWLEDTFEQLLREALEEQGHTLPPAPQYDPRIEEFIKVLGVCSILRRPLVMPPCGPQWSGESWDTQTRLMALVGSKITAAQSEYDDDDLTEEA